MATRSLGTLTIDLIARTLGFEQGMDRSARAMDKRVKELQRSAKQFVTALGATLAAGVTVAGAALAKITNDAIEYGDQLDELSNRLGISTEQLSAWGYAAKLTGSDLDSLAGAIPKLSKSLAAAMDSGSRQAELFDALGISVTDAAGNLRQVEDVLPEIADRFKTLDNDTTEAALAMELFGKSGAEFLEFLNLGSDGLAKMAGEAQKLGAIVDEQTAASAAEFKDELDKLSATATGLGTQLAAQLLPVIVDLVKEFRGWVEQGDLARNITTLITTAVDAAVGAINLYNSAVDRTSIAFEVLAETAAGAWEVVKNFATFGLADGSMAEGVGRISDAFANGQDRLDALGKQASRAPAPIPGVDEIDFTRGAPTAPGERTGLDTRINRFLTGSTDEKGRATKATKELTQAEKEWQEVMEVNALIDEEVEEFRRQQIADAYELDKAHEAAIARTQQQIADMETERDLIGRSNRERAQAIELRYADAEATDEQRQKIAELAGAIYDENIAMERQISAIDSIRDASTGFLQDLEDGVGFFDAMTNAVDRLADRLFDLAAEGLIDQLFGQKGDTGGGSWGTILNTAASLFGFGGGRAGGGWTAPNTLYQVNERGMEMATVRGRDYLLTGSDPVEITPNHRLGGGAGVSQVNHFHYAAPYDARTEEQKNARLGFETQRALRRNGA